MPLLNRSEEPDCWKALPSWGPEPAAPAGLTWQGLMRRALRLARAGAKAGEIPVGALVIDSEGEILSEAFVLAQTHRIKPFPIILYSHEFWDGLIDWLKDRMVKDGYLREEELDLVTICDTPEEVVRAIRSRVIL